MTSHGEDGTQRKQSEAAQDRRDLAATRLALAKATELLEAFRELRAALPRPYTSMYSTEAIRNYQEAEERVAELEGEL